MINPVECYHSKYKKLNLIQLKKKPKQEEKLRQVSFGYLVPSTDRCE